MPRENEALTRLKWEIGSLLQKCKLLSKSIKSSRPSRCFSIPQTFPSIAKDTADQLAHLYVTRFEPVFRLLHIPSFWVEYDKYWSDPTDAETVTQLKIQLVIAIGKYNPPRHYWHHRYLLNGTPVVASRAGMAVWTREKESDQHREHTAAVSTDPGSAGSCRGGRHRLDSNGTVVRTAMQMGLHRDPKHFKKDGHFVRFGEFDQYRTSWLTIIFSEPVKARFADDSGPPS